MQTFGQAGLGGEIGPEEAQPLLILLPLIRTPFSLPSPFLFQVKEGKGPGRSGRMGRGDGWGCGQRGDSPSDPRAQGTEDLGWAPPSLQQPLCSWSTRRDPTQCGKEKQRTGWVRRWGRAARGRGQKPDGPTSRWWEERGFNGMKGSQTELSPLPQTPQAPLKGFAFDPGPSHPSSHPWSREIGTQLRTGF